MTGIMMLYNNVYRYNFFQFVNNNNKNPFTLIVCIYELFHGKNQKTVLVSMYGQIMF